MRGSALLAGPRLRGERRRRWCVALAVLVLPATPVPAAGTHEPRVDAPRTRRGRVSRVRASSRQTCAGGAGAWRWRCRCWRPVHMGALLAGSRELGPDECHHWLDHVRNCEACTGPLVKTLIAQLVYLVLCGIRLIAHGTRLTRVCIFRYTWAGSCHGWNSYGTRRPRVCGVPCVSAPRVPAGGMPGTLLPPVCGPPANWGQACAAGAPSGTRPTRVSCNRADSRQECTGAYRKRTRLPRVSCNRANSRQECTGTQHRPYSSGPSSRTPCKLAAGVYRRFGRRQTW